VGAIIRLR